MTDRRWVVDPTGNGFPGVYRVKLGRNAWAAPVRLRYIERADRSPIWLLTVMGEEHGGRVPASCLAEAKLSAPLAGEPIDAATYAHLVATASWAQSNAPHAPEANPRQPIDLLTAPIPF